MEHGAKRIDFILFLLSIANGADLNFCHLVRKAACVRRTTSFRNREDSRSLGVHVTSIGPWVSELDCATCAVWLEMSKGLFTARPTDLTRSESNLRRPRKEQPDESQDRAAERKELII